MTEPAATSVTEPVTEPGDAAPTDQSAPADQSADAAAAAYSRRMVHDVQATFNGTTKIEHATFGAQSAPVRPTSTLTSATGRVGDDDLSAALGRFVRPACFDTGLSRLAHDRLVVLCDLGDTGKRSSALALLREVTDGALYMLSPGISLDELAEYDYEPGCGYLVVDRVVDQEVKETDFDWRVVRDRVEDRTCHLVVTRPARLSGAEQFGHLEWSPPDAARVLRAHWPHPWPDEHAEALGDALASIDRVRDVVGLAGQLAEGKSPDAAIAHLDTRVRAEVEEWFDAEPDRRRVLEVTALLFTTTLDERTFEAALSRLRRALAEYLPEPKPAEEEGTEEPHLPQLRKKLLENTLVGIETVRTDLGTRRAMKFAKPEYPRHVAAQLWERMDVVFWDAVDTWLDQIVVRRPYEVSVAEGLAGFATTALDEVLPVLDRWARGARGDAGQRTAVFVLYFMAYDDSLAPTALRIATDWITRGKPTHRWVAAMAFIGGLGVRYPHDARRRLWQVCAQSHTVDGEVEQVFGELFTTLVRDTDYAHLVLNFLVAKVERFTRPGARPAMRNVAVRTALAVLEAEDVTTRRSSVLTYLSEFPDRVGLVARLLASVLVHRPIRLRAIGALRGLLEDLAKNDKRARERAEALGEALRAELPPDEHGSLDEDFRIVAARKKDTDIRSLVDAILDALKGRVA